MVTIFGQVTAGGQKPQPVHLWSPRHTRAHYSTLAQKSRSRALFVDGNMLEVAWAWAPRAIRDTGSGASGANLLLHGRLVRWSIGAWGRLNGAYGSGEDAYLNP